MKHQKLNDPLTEHLRRVQNSSGTQLIQEMVSHMYEGRTKGDLLDFYVRPGGYGYDEKRPRAETLAALDKAYASWLKEIGKKGRGPSDYRSRNEAEEVKENAGTFRVGDRVKSHPKGPNFGVITKGSPESGIGKVTEVDPSGEIVDVRWSDGSEACYSPVDLIKV